MAFAKPQRLLIISHITRTITYTHESVSLKIPPYFKNGGCLIGAAVGDIQPNQREDFQSDKKSTGPIYDELTFPIIGQTIIDLYDEIGDAIRVHEPFFPDCGTD